MIHEEPQVLIHDEKEEAFIIGCLLVDNTAYTRISQYLDGDCFYDHRFKTIWGIIDKMVKNGIPVDLISVSGELLKNTDNQVGVELLVDVTNKVASSANAEYHAMRLKDLSRRRKMWQLSILLGQAGISEEVETTEIHKQAVEVFNGIFEQVDGVSTLTDAMDSLNKMIQQNLTQGSGTTGTPTGFSAFDKKGGLQKSDLLIVAGETSQGKTSLALSITRNALMEGGKVAFYSMEMTKEQLTARMLAAISNVAANNILYSGSLSPQELALIDEARGKLNNKSLYFDDRSTSNIDSILMSIRTMKMQFDIDGAVVDYLQILNVNSKGGSSREQNMGEAARRLKNIAKELNIWVIALSQLSRDSNSPEPTLNRLRDSGQIGEAADVVMLVYRPEYYNRTYPTPYDNVDEFPTNGTAMVDVAKGRNIGTFKFFLGFNKNTTSFYESDRFQTQEEQPFIPPIEADAPF